jgi:two-component system, NtrC family, sensor kinase
MSAGPEADAIAQALQLRANRMDIVSRWADDLAHEIKNPLHAMVINLELVKRRAGTAQTGELVERAEVVEAELHRVHTLVDALLRLVRPWLDRDRADVDSVFQDLHPVLAARARIRKLAYEHRAGGATVAIGPGPLTLLLLNLIDNAFEATGEGGRVTTACEVTAAQVRITVEDTGPGLPDPPHEALFAPGTARPGHTGLGLALARRLAQDAGGNLVLEPAHGHRGTLATVVLPRVGAA